MARRGLSYLAISASIACAISASRMLTQGLTTWTAPLVASASELRPTWRAAAAARLTAAGVPSSAAYPLRGATIRIVEGTAEVSEDGAPFRRLADGEQLGSADTVRTSPDAAALVTFVAGSEIELSGGALFELKQQDTAPASDSLASPEHARRAGVQVREHHGSATHEHTSPSVGMIRG